MAGKRSTERQGKRVECQKYNPLGAGDRYILLQMKVGVIINLTVSGNGIKG